MLEKGKNEPYENRRDACTSLIADLMSDSATARIDKVVVVVPFDFNTKVPEGIPRIKTGVKQN